MQEEGTPQKTPKKYIWIIVILALVILILIRALLFKSRPNSANNARGDGSRPISSPSGSQQSSSEEQNCSADSVKFTKEFTDWDKIDAFQPLGSITGASRGRSYIGIKKGQEVPVYAPADATLVSVIYAYRGPDSDHGEYGFKFNAGCGVSILLDHLDSASDEMKKYAPAEPARSTANNDTLSIPVKAGTLLGYTNGTSMARTFDFLVMDQNRKAKYINPARWQWDQSLYSVCPYDFYPNDLKTKYYQKIGEPTDSGFIKADDCGNPSYDIDNTISGGWFLDDQATDTHGQFMLIGYRLNSVDVTIKSESENSILRVTNYQPKVLPKDVGIGESVCYSGFSNDWVYLSLIDAKTIEVQNGSGSCPTSKPTTTATKYYR